MYRKYILPTFRFLKRKIGYSIINIIGLSIGIAISVMVFIFVYDELTYDRFNEKFDRIHLVCVDGKEMGEPYKSGWTATPMADALKKDYPEVEAVSRMFILWSNENTYMRYGDNIVSNLKLLGADSTLFDIFTFHFLEGNSNQSLNRPNTAVITKATAKKFFGVKNPIGKTISTLDGWEMEIVAVVEDCPSNSHIYFDVLFSMVSLNEADHGHWISNIVATYALLYPNVNKNSLDSKMPAFIKKYIAPVIQRDFNKSFEEFLCKNGDYYNFYFEPLKKVHLSTLLPSCAEGNASYITIICLVGILVLFLAIINYTNLATAISSTRVVEISIKKTFGASRFRIAKEFIGESIAISFLSMIVGMFLVELLLPLFNNLLGKTYEIDYLSNYFILPGLLIFATILGIATGIYPGMIISSQKTISILKNNNSFLGRKHNWARNSLVTIQFTVCIAIMIATLTIYQQIKYVQRCNLGINKEQVLVLDQIKGIKNNLATFKQTLLKNPNIISVAYVNTSPFQKIFDNSHHVVGIPYEGNLTAATYVADHDITNTIDLKLVTGRFFNESNTKDKYSVLINETMANKLNKENPLSIIFDGTGGIENDSTHIKVIGVIKDFHFRSMRSKISNAVIYPSIGREYLCNLALIKLSGQNTNETIRFIENCFKKQATNYPFKYSFLDEDFNLLYKNDFRTSKMLSICIFLAVIIALLGLLGLSSFIINSKTKEIGIRKALGASVVSIEKELIIVFLKWIVIANAIAWPIAYYFTTKWLDNFAYRIDFNWINFITVGAGSILIAILTVAYQTYIAASKKPIETLRYE